LNDLLGVIVILKDNLLVRASVIIVDCITSSFLALLMLLFTMHDVYPVTDADEATKLTGTEDLTKRPLHRTKKSSGVDSPAGPQALELQRRLGKVLVYILRSICEIVVDHLLFRSVTDCILKQILYIC